MPREVKGGATKEEGKEGRGETDWTKWKRGELSTFYPGVRRTEGVRETFVARKRTRSSAHVGRQDTRGAGAAEAAAATFGRVTDRFRMRRKRRRRDEIGGMRQEGRCGQQDRRRETVAQSGRLIRLGSRGRF